MRKMLAIAAAVAMLAGGAAHAATLSASGSVQLNQGGGFKPVSGVVSVKPGDRILVGAGGSASVAYGANCTRSVAPNAMSTVMANSPCEGRMRQAGGNDDDGMLIVGGVLAGGAIGAIIYTATRGNNKASP